MVATAIHSATEKGAWRTIGKDIYELMHHSSVVAMDKDIDAKWLAVAQRPDFFNLSLQFSLNPQTVGT